MCKHQAARFAFHLLRRFPRLAQTILPWSLTHMSFAIPLHKLRETPTLIAFHHPKPNYPTHVLILPKKTIANLASLTAQEAPLLVDVFQVTNSLVEELGLEAAGYRLIVNGGTFQDIPQLHWHLVAGAT